MSVSRWRYTEACDGDFCPGDCDYCNKNMDIDDLIWRQDVIEALEEEEPEVWNNDDYELGQRNQWESDIAIIRGVGSYSARTPSIDYKTQAREIARMSIHLLIELQELGVDTLYCELLCRRLNDYGYIKMREDKYILVDTMEV